MHNHLMTVRHIMRNAFSTQFKEYRHHPHDYIILLGTLSGVMCVTLGISMSLFLSVLKLPPAYAALGLFWAFFGMFTLWGVLVFRAGKREKSAAIFIVSGAAGMLLGSGFFLGAALSVFTGGLVVRDMYGSRKKKK